MSLPARVFECPICFQVLTNPVWCSRCGKLFCEEHVARISECPFCKDKPFRPQVERVVRLLLEEMPYPCKYCKEPISKGNLERSKCTKLIAINSRATAASQVASSSLANRLKHCDTWLNYMARPFGRATLTPLEVWRVYIILVVFEFNVWFALITLDNKYINN